MTLLFSLSVGSHPMTIIIHESHPCHSHSGFISAFNLKHDLGEYNWHELGDWDGHLEAKKREIGCDLPAEFEYHTWPLAIRQRFNKVGILKELQGMWELGFGHQHIFEPAHRLPTTQQHELYQSIFNKPQHADTQLRILMAYGPEFVREMDQQALRWSR